MIAIPYSYKSPATYVDTNINGTLNLLEAARDFGVKKIVETTSGVGRTILQQEHTLVGGSENLVLSDYETYFFATGSVGLTLRSSDGHLLIDLP